MNKNEPNLNNLIAGALDFFQKEFPNAIYANLTVAGLISNYQANGELQAFIEKILTHAITTAFEACKVNELILNDTGPSIHTKIGWNAAVQEMEAAQQKFLQGK